MTIKNRIDKDKIEIISEKKETFSMDELLAAKETYVSRISNFRSKISELQELINDIDESINVINKEND